MYEGTPPLAETVSNGSPRPGDVTTIVIADDHPVFRSILRVLLDSVPELHLVGEAADGHEAVQAVERLDPDVLVVDLIMPGLNGFEVIRRVTERSPRTRVIVLSAHDDEVYVSKALTSGAAGYAVKNTGTAELVLGIRTVASGRRYLSPPLAAGDFDAGTRSAERPAES